MAISNCCKFIKINDFENNEQIKELEIAANNNI